MSNIVIRGGKDDGNGVTELLVDANGVLVGTPDLESPDVVPAQSLAESLADGSTVVAVGGKLTVPAVPPFLAGTVQTYVQTGLAAPGAVSATGAKAGDTVVGVISLTDQSDNAPNFEATVSVDDQIQQTSITDLSSKRLVFILQRFGGNGSFSVDSLNITYSAANQVVVPAKAGSTVRHGRLVRVTGDSAGFATVVEADNNQSAGLLGVCQLGGDGAAVNAGAFLGVVVAGPARIQIGTFQTPSPGQCVIWNGTAATGNVIAGAPGSNIRVGTLLSRDSYAGSGGSRETTGMVTISVAVVKPATVA